jgi:translation initiation factor IF-1
MRRRGEAEAGPEPDRGRLVKATVLELLPQAACRCRLEDRRLVLAHAAGAARVNFVRIRPGDRVWLELSPADPTRGRITGLLTE